MSALPYCSSLKSRKAVEGNYLECTDSTAFRLEWPWEPPYSGHYDVYVKWAWRSGDQCYIFEGESTYTCGGSNLRAGAWFSLGNHHLREGGRYPVVGPVDATNFTIRMDAVRYVLTKADSAPRDYKYVHTDALGTPLRVTDQGGTVVWAAMYDPFGIAAVDSDPDGDGTQLTLNLRFPGQYYDAETGFHYNYFRDYDPDKGRYLQSDPIGLAGGVNTYAYVMGNPIRYTDPLGLEQQTRDYVGNNGYNGERGTFGGAMITDAISTMWNADHLGITREIIGNGLNSAGQTGTCMATCAATNFIGLTPGAFAKNMTEQSVVYALGQGAKEAGCAVSKKAAGAAGLLLTARDTAGTVDCATRCLVGP